MERKLRIRLRIAFLGWSLRFAADIRSVTDSADGADRDLRLRGGG